MRWTPAFGHVAIKVRDLAATLDFYEKKLGFPEMMRLNHDDGSPWLVYLRITDEVYLEIFPGAETDRAPGPGANGMNHFCLAVADIETAVAEIKAKGLRLTVEIKMGLDGNRQAWMEDPDGNRIELMEMSPGCMQFEAIKRLKALAG